MTIATAHRRAQLLDALPHHLSGAATGGRTLCRLDTAESSPEDRVDVAGTARITEHWLDVEFAWTRPLPVSTQTLWHMLGHNGLRPGVKFSVTCHGGAIIPRLHGELWLGQDPARLRRRLDGLFADLADAWNTVADAAGPLEGRGPRIPDDAGAAQPLAALDLERWQEACREAQWPAAIGPSGALTVSLDAGRFPCQAHFEAAGGHVILSAEWATENPPSPPDAPAHRARAAYLLAASGAVRLAALGCVRAAGETGTGAVVARTALPPDAGAEDVANALAALSVAARLCGPETALLYEDQELAQAWMGGWSVVTDRAT